MAHDHSHTHASSTSSFKILLIGLAIITFFAVVEAFSGWFSNSLTLMSDAGHMGADALSLAIAASATFLARRPPSSSHTFGFKRLEVISALFSGLLLLAIVVAIVVEAVENLKMPEQVHAPTMIYIGLLGILVNAVAAYILQLGESNINVRAAFIHVLSDLLGSLAAVIGGLIILTTHWMPADPIISLLICLLILRSTYRLIKEAMCILMEGTPGHLDVNEVGKEMKKIEGVKSIHDLHVWMISEDMISLSAHIVIDDFSQWKSILTQIKTALCEKYHIKHVTLQPESSDFETVEGLLCTKNSKH